MQANFTCITCRLAFDDAESQRDHYKTELHRYNLMRKVAVLPPVSQAEFASRAEAQRLMLQPAQKNEEFSCAPCNKGFSSSGAYKSHMQSKKHSECAVKSANKKHDAEIFHKRKVKKLAADHVHDIRKAKTEAEALEILDARIASAPRLNAVDCLFCVETCGSTELCVVHMAQKHSFFIPDLEFLVDLPGLLEYLGEKISVGNICLTCNGKGKAFHSLESVRRHMIEKGHCRVAWDTEDERAEIEEFYNYNMADLWQNVNETEEEICDDDAEAWSDVDSEDGFSDSRRPERGMTINDRLELVLPDGSTVAHRALLKFYRDHSRSELADSHPVEINRAMHRSLAGHPAASTLQKKAERQRDFAQKHRDLKLGMKNNSQKHFRDQMLQ